MPRRIRTLLATSFLQVVLILLPPTGEAWSSPAAACRRDPKFGGAIGIGTAATTSPSLLRYSTNSGEGGGDESNSSRESGSSRERRRMEMVRSLQTAFYGSDANKSSSSATRTSLDSSTGSIRNLPLWRVPWIELPGRTNVLSVHDPLYTNMFENILHTADRPWLVGHLYLPPEGSKNLHSPEHRLRTWDEQADKSRGGSGGAATTGGGDLGPMSASASVLGTILRIADYRRLVDGRLLLLVQALEKFAVTDVVQEFPYGVAHVQLVPDSEEVDDESDWVSTRTESEISDARALAVAESFGRWHRYEYERTLLPLPSRREIEAEEIVGSAIAKVLPYAPYSSVVEAGQVLNEGDVEIARDSTSVSATAVADREETDDAHSSSSTLEQRLVEGSILYQPKTIDPALLRLSCDELEIRLWLALNDYLKKSRKAVSPVLLGFVPRGVKWPKGFILEKIADMIGEQTQLNSKFVRLPKEYPSGRRQKRLSYSIAALLEDIDTVNGFRQELLAIPSTKARMAYVLQLLLEDGWGAFQ